MTNRQGSSRIQEDAGAELDFVLRVVEASEAQNLGVDELAAKVGMSFRELAVQLLNPEILLLGTARRLATVLDIPLWSAA